MERKDGRCDQNDRTERQTRLSEHWVIEQLNLNHKGVQMKAKIAMEEQFAPQKMTKTQVPVGAAIGDTVAPLSLSEVTDAPGRGILPNISSHTAAVPQMYANPTARVRRLSGTHL